MLETGTIETVMLFKQPELYIYYRNFTPLIKFAVENDKSSIIDRVNSISDIGEILFKLYIASTLIQIDGRQQLAIVGQLQFIDPGTQADLECGETI